jgi:CheY-like chemotaxis protein
MDKVLIAEDNPVLQKILKAGLKKYQDKFETITAKDGQEAIEILEASPVELLVTDLQMPRIDGLSLLAYMHENHPEIPCIVMTAHGTPQLREKLQQDVLSFIEKPFEIDDLVKNIIPALDRSAPEGTLHGISIASFLQMIEMEQKTCLFEVESPEGKGFFYFEDGVLYDAICGEYKGLEAALKLIPMENAKIRLKNVGKTKKKISRRIKQEVMGIIMEAMRLKDESAAEPEEFDLQSVADELTDDLPKIDDFDLLETEKALSGTFTEEIDSSIAIVETEEPPEEVVFKPIKEESVINLKGYIEDLKSINGYRASAIMNFSGEILESDTIDPAFDLNYTSAVFNDIFQSANRACEKIGFDSNQETCIVTPKGIIIMSSSGSNAKTHIHVIAILEPSGNQALMKMEMKRMLPAVVSELD